MQQIEAVVAHLRAAFQPGLSRRLMDAERKARETDRQLERQIESQAVDAWVRLSDAAAQDDDEDGNA